MSRPHAAAIVEDAWHRQFDRVLRRRGWRNRIIGHVGYGSTDFVRVFARVVLSRVRDECDEKDDDPTYGGLRSPFGRSRGWRVFFTAPAMDVPITITAGEHVAHGRSDRSGHVDLTFRGHGLDPGWHQVRVVAQNAEPVDVEVFIVGDDVDYGLVSDIDDTVISTSLPRVFLAAWNTFVRHEGARRVVAGMAPLYRELIAGHPGAPVVYISTGAWNTAPPLTRFLRGHGYPVGPLLLTDWGPTNTGWFRSGQEHKRSCLDRLARDFPKIRWVLVGDDGQHDLKVYSDFAEARPERIDSVAIRQLTPTEQILSHGIPVPTEDLTARTTRASREIPIYYSPDGFGLLRILRDAGKVAAPVRADDGGKAPRSPDRPESSPEGATR
ncbi:phosphatase domain-containing protein [Lapillicoccus sp.]|uniref:App1 family protein n=1 Tax=Lapillicoccus sp. TaxID=1909287 RepID=UPI0025EAA204|nr:phosphatase domain-containing protein [Lapillicoccus sp.]